MEKQREQKTLEGSGRGTFTSYVVGFVLSVALTLVAYALVVRQTLDSNVIITLIMGLAVAQFLVQLVFFLHFGREPKPRWNLIVFSFMLMVLFILVLGTLWIMNNLDYHTMSSPEELDKQVIEDEGYSY